MNKYDELIDKLLNEQEEKSKNIRQLEKEKKALQNDNDQIESITKKNDEEIDQLANIREILERYSYKIPKDILYNRCIYMLVLLFAVEVTGTLLGFLFYLLTKQLIWAFLIIGPVYLILKTASDTYKNRQIIKNNNYDSITRSLNIIIDKNNKLIKSVRKSKEEIKVIDTKIKEETNIKEAIEAKIDKVYKQKYKALNSIINAAFDQELSERYDKDIVIKRELIKDGYNE